MYVSIYLGAKQIMCLCVRGTDITRMLRKVHIIYAETNKYKYIYIRQAYIIHIASSQLIKNIKAVEAEAKFLLNPYTNP